MNMVPADVVERTWKRIAALSPRSAPKLVKRMAKKQPIILAYLLAVDDDIFNQDERQQPLYLWMVAGCHMDTHEPDVNHALGYLVSLKFLKQ